MISRRWVAFSGAVNHTRSVPAVGDGDSDPQPATAIATTPAKAGIRNMIPRTAPPTTDSDKSTSGHPPRQ